MEKNINMSRNSNLRKSLICLLSTAGSALAISIPGAAFAQTAVNTARIAAPVGTFEINPANNESVDTDTVLAVIVADRKSVV